MAHPVLGLLFLFALCLPVHSHSCIHDKMTSSAPQSAIVEQNHAYPQDDTTTCYKAGDQCYYTDSDKDTGPCVCRESDVITKAKRELITKMMTEVQYFFEHLLLVVPREDDVLHIATDLGSARNCNITIPFSYVGGIKGYDYVLFVTSRPISTDLTLAFARSCQSERLGNLEGRPIVGIININPTPLDTSEASYRGQLGILLHEATHALGFSYDRFLRGFVKWDGSKWLGIPRKEILKSYKNSEIGHTVTRIITPEVKNAAEKHFDCPGLDGGELEDGGSGQTAGSHWEKRVFENEYMTGITTPYPVYSHLTAALFHDMGWYGVKDTANLLSPLIWGRNLGCDFCNNSCSTWPMNDEKEGYRCDATQPQDQCIFDMRGWGHCNSGIDNPLVVEPGCYFYQAATTTYCEFDSKLLKFTLDAGEKHGISSRCFHSSIAALPGALKSYTKFPQAPYMQCYPTICRSATELKVMVDDIWYDCPYEGGSVTPVGYGGELECKPKAADIVCTNSSGFDPTWPIFTAASPLEGTPAESNSFNNTDTVITIFGNNLKQIIEVEIGGSKCNNLTIISDMQLTVTLPRMDMYNSLASFGVLSSKASIVLRDSKGRTALGRDAFLLHLTLKGDDVSVFFKSLGLSTSAFTGLVAGLAALGVFSCGLFTFCRYWRQKKADSLSYKPEKYDLLREMSSSD